MQDDTLRELAMITGISSSKVHFILKKQLRVRKITRLQLGGPNIRSLKNKSGHVFLIRKNVEAVSDI